MSQYSTSTKSFGSTHVVFNRRAHPKRKADSTCSCASRGSARFAVRANKDCHGSWWRPISASGLSISSQCYSLRVKSWRHEKGMTIVPRMWERIRRRIQVEKNLFFEYEVSPHRSFVAKIARRDTHLTDKSPNSQSASPQLPKDSSQSPPSTPSTEKAALNRFGGFIPFKQARLQGQVNPLRPPIHLETVLIGRALGQSAGYRSGIGFRTRDDGYVEAEFADGVRKYDSLAEFELDMATRAKAPGSS
jgi:hypothetical protein